MKQPNRQRKRLPSGLAGSYDASDGMDPRFDPAPAREAGIGGSGDQRKLRQLCSQVLRTLQMIWPTDNASLDSTSPADVLPAPNSHNLLVMVDCTQPPEALPDQQILDAIAQKTDVLRGEVARAITRKRTPRLSFAVFPRPHTR